MASRSFETPPASLLECLEEGRLLNGDVISAFLRLIERRNSMVSNLPKVLGLDTYFFTSWERRGFHGVRRQILGENLFNKDVIFVPVHDPVAYTCGHWYLVVIEPEKRQISAYDSKPNRDHRPALESMARFMGEYNSKLTAQPKEWRMWGVRTSPAQENGTDCGVYVCAVADALARRIDLKGIQGLKASEFRKKMFLQLKTGDMGHPDDFPELVRYRSPLKNPKKTEEDWDLDDWEKEFARLAPPPLLSPLTSPAGSPKRVSRASVGNPSSCSGLLQQSRSPLETSAEGDCEMVKVEEPLSPSNSGPSTSSLTVVIGDAARVIEIADITNSPSPNDVDPSPTTSTGGTVPVDSGNTLMCTSIFDPEEDVPSPASVLSLHPPDDLESNGSSIEVIEEPTEDDWTMVPMEVEEEDEMIGTARVEATLAETAVTSAVVDNVATREEPIANDEEDVASGTLQPRKRRKGGKRRVMRIFVPQLGRLKRINVRHLGLEPHHRMK